MIRMGFEENRNRINKQSFGRRCQATIGGRDYTFDSMFERNWARYLQFLMDHDKIIDWVYQPIKWDFWPFNYRNKPYEYSPDFLITEPDGQDIYQETKGYIRTYDISRISRANKHFGPVTFDLVMQRVPRRGKHSQILARASDKAYIRRIVNASEIFRQLKGVL